MIQNIQNENHIECLTSPRRADEPSSVGLQDKEESPFNSFQKDIKPIPIELQLGDVKKLRPREMWPDSIH